MPYRTLDDRIDGVVITFADITTAKTLEAQLREKARRSWKSTSRNNPKEAAIISNCKQGRQLRSRAEAHLREQKKLKARRGEVRSGHPAAAPRIAGPPDRTGDAERRAAGSQG
jgi:hypothetical protein